MNIPNFQFSLETLHYRLVLVTQGTICNWAANNYVILHPWGSRSTKKVENHWSKETQK